MPGPLSPLLRPFGPRLWRPGQVKPHGNWKINWDHPLTQGLVSYWLDSGFGILVDLVNYRIATAATSNTTPLTGSNAFGHGFLYPGGAVSKQMADPAIASNQAWTAPFSCALGWVPIGNASAATVGYFELSDSSANSAFAFVSSAASLVMAFVVGNAGLSGLTFTPTANSFNVGIGVATGASAQQYYVNGKSIGTAALTSAFTGTTLHYNFNAAGAAYTGTGNSVNSYVLFGAAWLGRALTQADAALLYTDPYCLLLPQEPEMMIIQGVPDVLYSQIWV